MKENNTILSAQRFLFIVYPITYVLGFILYHLIFTQDLDRWTRWIDHLFITAIYYVFMTIYYFIIRKRVANSDE
ncbi:hypothetical protein [Salinithrix halophila]|uniref:Uncharacterized protein n=1 Tax=Salinithrix halophila TaxID=1485204 RepID=A0ABV8JA09_9BACL